MNIDLLKYQEFVRGVTSQDSMDIEKYLARVAELAKQGCQISQIDTGFTGMCSESGEALDIIKKLKFQNKPWTPELREHMLKELGDVIFYWTLSVYALGADPNEVIAANEEKLRSRYPGGVFDAVKSEKRATGDI